MSTNTQDERQYLDSEQAKRLYDNDQTFRQLVDCMVMLIHRLQLTPGEVRSAATYAAILYEMRYPKKVYVAADALDEATRQEVLRVMQEPGYNLRIPTPPQSPVSKTPIGVLRSDQEPCPLCGCICHVCAQIHSSGEHSALCRDRVLGHRLRGWKEREG